MIDETYLKFAQKSAYSSPWTLRQRVGMLLWQFCWTFFCGWTPKPLNAWRIGWLKLFGCKVIGKPFVHQYAHIQIPWNLTLHDRACLGDGANAYTLGPIEIGREATVAQEAYLCTGTHDLADRDTPLITAAIKIGAHAFIGARAFVMPGVTIGEGAVLGAMSVATRSIPAWTICAGNPAQPIRQRREFRMRINIVQGAFLPVPALRGGAVEKVWYVLGRELARAGCDVTHISRQYTGLPDDEVRDGVRYLRVPGFDTAGGALWPKLQDLVYAFRVRRVLPVADITVTNTFWMPMLLRDSTHGATYVHVARFPRRQMRFYRHVARLQPVSSIVGDAIRSQTPSVAQLVRPLPNPLPENWLAEDEILTRARSSTVLYVGRVHPEKGLDLLIDAFTQLPEMIRSEWTLVVVGPAAVTAGGGGEEYLDYLKARAVAGKLAVDWVGAIYDSELLKAQYDRSPIFVYPSRAAQGEALPLAPVEAMARGCTPVVSSLECFRDYLRHRENGVMFPADASDPARELAEVLLDLIQRPQERQRLQLAALRTASNYTVERVARQYLNDFESLAGSA